MTKLEVIKLEKMLKGPLKLLLPKSRICSIWPLSVKDLMHQVSTELAKFNVPTKMSNVHSDFTNPSTK